MRLNVGQKIAVLFFGANCIWWIYINLTKTYNNEISASLAGMKIHGTVGMLYAFVYGVVPLVIGIYGMYLGSLWGGFKSAIGRAVVFISSGLFMWGVGSQIWSYYNFFQNQDSPYPSLADIGFILAIPFYAIGMINLSKATGAKFGLKNKNGKAILIIIPILVILVSYYLLVNVARGGVLSSNLDSMLKLFFDLAYPIGDIITLAVALVVFGLSLNFLGGRYKVTIIALLLGFLYMYLSDFVFSYRTSLDVFYNGDICDLFFTIAFGFMTFAIAGFTLPSEKGKSYGRIR